MHIISGMFAGHDFAYGRPLLPVYPTETNTLIVGGVVRCPADCTQMVMHYSYDGVVMPIRKLQVDDADEARRLKADWPAEFWKHWQLGEDRRFHLRPKEYP